jgi:hypothetical protein
LTPPQSGAVVRGSAFFPITPAPTRLVVRYRVRDIYRELVLDLKQLSQLHLAPPDDGAAEALARSRERKAEAVKLTY